jgi:integrase
MARTLHRLSPTTVRTAKPGMHCDGGGLYLQATPGADGTIRRSWLFRFGSNGSERYMGLGSLDTVGLAQAREKAADCRVLRQSGIDPIEAREAERAAAQVESAQAMTFDDCRDAYIAAHRAGWRSIKHATQWTNSLKTYVTPIFGKLPVQTIDVGLVTKALEPIWTTKTDTASRVRGRVEAILDWAKVRGYRKDENPARWRGHLDHLLPSHSKVRKVEHYAALPYEEIGAFMGALREREGSAARALEFTILTAARTGETIGARWDEINRQTKAWAIPGDRMKSGNEHRVPLSEAAVTVLEHMAKVRENVHVFPGDRRVTLSNMALLMLLRRMGRGDLTVHGFRSTFRDWTAERTNFSGEVAEAALAHTIANKVEAAYRRSDLFEKRRALMQQWGSFCEQQSGKDDATLVPPRLGASEG